ncbi:hypothetical protein V1525DRAFT_401994 [Lipomyces kononenkoae]|uniref:Uncharacterized protein n=1 Tax=Lipomyces kononenkoae TaxID=34357 RepID=A0ACC3T2E1_LIPKO
MGHPGVWGFVDGNLRPICRPTPNQTIVYPGYKGVDAFKLQYIVIPDISDFYPRDTWEGSDIENSITPIDSTDFLNG